MIFMPEADTWLRLYPLPGTDISEVVDAFARVMMISALVDKKHKGMFFIGNGVTICRI